MFLFSGKCIEFLWRGRRERKKVLYQWINGCNLYFYLMVYIRGDWDSTPGFNEFEASSLSGPVIGPCDFSCVRPSY